MFEKVLNFLNAQGWQYHIIDKKQTVALMVTGSFGTFRCVADLEEEGVFMFYSIYSINAPKNSFPKLSEFLTRINYNRVIGNFELDYSDGEIRYKTSAYYKGLLEDEIIEKLIMVNIVSMDKLLLPIANVIHSESSVEKILSEIDGFIPQDN